jgi:predicted DNA-binding transcriptional regulator AlpA
MELKHQEIRKPTDLADSIVGKTRALRVNDVATLLSISERQVYKMAAAQLIPSFWIGGSIRFDPAITAAWLREKMAPSSSERKFEVLKFSGR